MGSARPFLSRKRRHMRICSSEREAPRPFCRRAPRSLLSHNESPWYGEFSDQASCRLAFTGQTTDSAPCCCDLPVPGAHRQPTRKPKLSENTTARNCREGGLQKHRSPPSRAPALLLRECLPPPSSHLSKPADPPPTPPLNRRWLPRPARRRACRRPPASAPGSVGWRSSPRGSGGRG